MATRISCSVWPCRRYATSSSSPVDGVRTAYPAYTEKQRAHALITEASAWSQKNSAGSWGTVIRRPIAIAQMLGI